MPLDVVAAERFTCQERGLEVDLGPEGLCPPQRLRHDVERKLAVRAVRDGQANAVDRNRVADLRVEGALDNEAALVERRDLPALANEVVLTAELQLARQA